MGSPSPLNFNSTAENKQVNSGIKFTRVKDPLAFVNVLESRLPNSAPVYNAAKQTAWHDEQVWFVLNLDGSDLSMENSWICVTYTRDDFGQEICISAPANPTITDELIAAFSSCEFIDWASGFVFAAVEPEVSKVMADIGIRDKGNCLVIHPCNLYYMDIEDGLNLNTNFALGKNVKVKDINDDLGIQFILDTWKYTTEGSKEYVTKVVRRNESAGVYVDIDGQGEKVVSGVGLSSHGLIGMLYTDKNCRGKGYGKYVMHSVMKKVSEKGLVPSCTVELRNSVSKAFQLKIGFKVACVVDFVVFENTGF